MRAQNLRVNSLAPSTYTWYQDYLAALDDKDVERYGSFLAEDCALVMNNAEPIRGKDAVLEGLSAYWQTFDSLEHDLLNIYGSDQAFVLEALNHYRRLDGQAITLRAVALTDRNEAGEVTSVRLYSDTTPLFAPA